MILSVRERIREFECVRGLLGVICAGVCVCVCQGCFKADMELHGVPPPLCFGGDGGDGGGC